MWVELAVGDRFCYFGSMVAQQVSTIMKGIQESLDFFTHASNFQLLIKNQEKAGKKTYPQKEG